MPERAPSARIASTLAHWSGRLLRPGLRQSLPRRLNLALQGGGAHGAFTWGVLDALLNDTRLAFEGISGSSAGAMNAVAFADGWIKGGREGARQGLAAFWTEIGKQLPAGLAQGVGEAMGLSPVGKLMTNWVGHFSPAQFNPFELNPLRDLLNRQIDFASVRAHCPFKLFIGATQANTGQLRLFRESELTVDVLLASACLPKLHHSVEIDGEPYWDGGYSANPAVFPLAFDCATRDILLVLLSPLRHAHTPRTVQDIESRIAELAFSAHFNREMRMFAHALAFSGSSWMHWGRLERRLQAVRLHMIDTSELAALHRTDTKLLAHTPFLEMLMLQGQQRAVQWLNLHGDDVGKCSSLDIQKNFA